MENKISRRSFLLHGAWGHSNLPSAAQGSMPRLAFAPAQTAPRGDVLLVVFLRGAADGLNMVVPHADADYYVLRPTLGIAPRTMRVPRRSAGRSTWMGSSACTRHCARCSPSGR